MILRRVIEHVRKQEWTAIAIDFVIVVAGVFVGIQVANWNETRRDRELERVYLTRIAADLAKSTSDIDHSIRRAQEREDLGRLLMRAVADEQPVRAEPGRFIAALLVASYTFTPGIRSLAFDEMKSVGDLALIQDKQMLDEISEYYTKIRECPEAEGWRRPTDTNPTLRDAALAPVSPPTVPIGCHLTTTDLRPTLTGSPCAQEEPPQARSRDRPQACRGGGLENRGWRCPRVGKNLLPI